MYKRQEDLYPATVNPDSHMIATAKAAAKAAAAGTPAKAIRATPPAGTSGDTYAHIGNVKNDFIISRTWSLVAVYFFVCYATVIVSYYAPFLMKSEGLGDSDVGTVTAIFFLAVFLPGFILPSVIKLFKQHTLVISTLVMVAGIIMMVEFHKFGMLCVASVLIGFGYGVFQPVIYDKATQIVTVPAKSTLALAIVLAANYISISATPFIVDFFRSIFDPHHLNNAFPFALNAILLAIFLVVMIIFRKSFVFHIDPSYY
ncbi:MAG: MFS transporter [Duncaniella sp.]|nr:MFS transporter [Duncaniella sp.]